MTYIDDIKMNLVYNACDLLLMPSLEEGFGYPVVRHLKLVYQLSHPISTFFMKLLEKLQFLLIH